MSHPMWQSESQSNYHLRDFSYNQIATLVVIGIVTEMMTVVAIWVVSGAQSE